MQVSIIMPYFNAANYIKETVSSIISQTYKKWELIIVNDCSTDPNTQQVLGEVKDLDDRIKIINQRKNVGAGLARNVGIKIAQGKYIAFCDSDDWWYPTKLEEQLLFMQENHYPFTCTWYEDADENLVPYYVMKQSSRNNYKSLIAGCNIGTPGVVIDVEVLGKLFMPNLRRAEDWGLWMMYLKQTDYIYTYPKALWKYRHVSGSETSNKWQLMQSVIMMYCQVLGYKTIKAWMVCLFVFLPNNIWKKVKKIV